MKTLLVVLFAAVAVPVCGRIITVSNSPLNPGQFPSVTLAMSIAVAGDTLYVHGSPINYGVMFLSHNGITVIGTGHSPQKQFPYVAQFTTVNVDGDNCQVIGIVAENIVVSSPNVIIKRCKILGSPGGGLSGIEIPGGVARTVRLEGNVFTGAGPASNVRIGAGSGDIVFIQNNIFSSIVDTPGTASPLVFQILNNIFLGGFHAFNFIDKVTINNNIFYNSSPFVPISSTITTKNNISFQCTVNSFSVGAGITSSNNLEGVNPQFVSYPGGSAVFSFLHDYNLAPGSPGLATGSDGTDRGVYGGFGTIFNMTGEPAIAEISSVTITSPTTVAPGGTLNVTVTSRRIH